MIDLECAYGFEDALRLYQEAARRGEQAAAILPQHANSHYLHAAALGRYGQGISVAKALAEGLGGKVRRDLDRTLELEPDHAEACIALGVYHVQVVATVGSMVGRLTHGARTHTGFEYFRRALSLTPHSPLAHMEYANALLCVHGEARLEEATRAYMHASEIRPRDAMERLDIEQARFELEDED